MTIPASQIPKAIIVLMAISESEFSMNKKKVEWDVAEGSKGTERDKTRSLQESMIGWRMVIRLGFCRNYNKTRILL